MTIQRAKWKKPLTKNQVPTWPCPECEHGVLVHDAKGLQVESTAKFRFYDERVHMEADAFEGHFAGFLRCNNSDCAAPVAVCGEASVSRGEDPHVEPAFKLLLTPTFFSPALPLFAVPESCTEPIQEAVKRVWALYWVDEEACANAIRACLELLLTHLRIPQTAPKKSGGRRRLNLAERIDVFTHRNAARHAKLADHMTAVRWLGNAGSHGGGDGLSKDDALDGMDLLSHVLSELFDPVGQHIQQIAKQINKRKGPAKRR